MRLEEIFKPIPEQSTPTFIVSFKDETGAPCTPEVLTWDLSTLDGTVIALAQSVAIPSTTNPITLTEAQTRILNGESRKGERLLTIHATYNSAYGIGLKTHRQVKFTIEQFTMIGYPLDVAVIEVVFTDDYLRDLAVV